MKSALLMTTVITILLGQTAKAGTEKGLLPEIRISENEEENKKKAFSSEVMITRSENKAIESLQSILKNKKGSPIEVDLWYRLGELYMKRSRSGRFFDLNRESPVLKQSSFPVPNENGADALKRATKIYDKIQNEFPKFSEMDSVLFNNAFACQQLGDFKKANILYTKLIAQHPKSILTADSLLALAEILYDQGHFDQALIQYKNLEKYPQSRGYTYGLYKAAWAYYNMHENKKAIEKLVEVIQLNSTHAQTEPPKKRQNLHSEALRDLTLFAGEHLAANQLYSFFKKITTEQELGNAMLNLAKIFESHSRQKEITIFLSEYIKDNENGFMVVQARLALVEAYETLKLRPLVIENLKSASDLCRKDSTWRALQTKETTQSSCNEWLHHIGLDLTKKWFDIWSKNKSHHEFAELTQKLFKTLLDSEDIEKPDVKTRYAYAELLFLLNNFEESTDQYKIVSVQCNVQTHKTLCHDADYAALVSKEKSNNQEKSPLKISELKELAAIYISKYPKAEFTTEVQLKLAHILYEENNYQDSERWLRIILEGKDKVPEALLAKSEDLFLDIMNIKKDFSGISAFAKQILNKTKNNDRKQTMTKIVEETEFAQLQDSAKNSAPDVAIKKLMAFITDHPTSSLAREAFLQSIGIAYSSEKLFTAAELSLQFNARYPSDNRNKALLKDAAKSYSDIGHFEKSADVLMKLSQLDGKTSMLSIEAAADLYLLENNHTKAQTAYNLILDKMRPPQETKTRIFSKLLDSYAKENNIPALTTLQNKILQKGTEPYTTQLMTKKAKQLFDAKKYQAAFELAMKINSRDIAAEYRAESRLIQARILEKELVEQSVKASEAKFAVVIGLKTERLDKAQTAYLSALKMSKDPQQQIEALSGVDRTYSNYIDSLTTIPLPSSLSKDDQIQLKKEISKIITPIVNKKNENRQKLAQLNTANSKNLNLYEAVGMLMPDQSIEPLVKYLPFEKMPVFLPSIQNNKPLAVSLSEKNSKKETAKKLCNKSNLQKLTSTKAELISNLQEFAENCQQSRQFDLLSKLGLEISNEKETRDFGLFLSSLAAEQQGLNDKATVLIEAALKLNSRSENYIYQKGRIIYKTDGLLNALPIFEKLFSMQVPSTELKTFAGIKAFSDRDFTKAIDFFSSLSKEQLYTYHVGILMSEALAQKGDVEKALNIASELLSYNEELLKKNLKENNTLEIKNASVELLLQQAHLLEVYKSSLTLALDSYERASKVNTQGALQDWLAKKIEYIKKQNKVGQHVHSADY